MHTRVQFLVTGGQFQLLQGIFLTSGLRLGVLFQRKSEAFGESTAVREQVRVEQSLSKDEKGMA